MVRLRFIVSLLLVCTNSLYSQSDQLDQYIQDKLSKIDYNIENKEFDLALTKIEELESYSDYIKNDENRLKLNLLKAKVYNENEEHEESLKLLLKGLNELEYKEPLLILKIEYTSYIGKVFRYERNYMGSNKYYKRNLSISRELNDTINELNAYFNLGVNFEYLNLLDSAYYYYNEVIKFPVRENTESIISNTYNNLGNVAGISNDLELALEYYEKSLEITRNQNDTIGMTEVLVNIASIFYDKKEYEKAGENYLMAIDKIKNLKTERALKVKEYALYNLSYVNEERRNFENAYKFLIEATNLTDSLAEANRIANISEIEAKYNVAREAQKAEEEKSKRLKAQVFFYGLAFAFLSFIVVGYIFYRNYRLKQQSKLELLENEAQTRIINATIDAKEKERKSIAETLHDSVSALLSSANLHLQATKAQLKKEAPQEISKAQVIVNEASVKIRDLSHELISSVLLKFGLAFAVHDMCQKYSNSELTLHSDDDGIKRYDQDFEIKVHNIIEELINNILKHSKASHATIMLSHRENDMLSIRISDDGVGFDVKKVRNKDGLGLSHIHARIKVMKGVFNIVSSKDNGTSIFILIPIQSKKVA